MKEAVAGLLPCPTNIFTCPVPLQLFLIFGPSTPPAMRPQMRCLSLPPAPAPSSYRTMPGGFPRFQPGEWGAGGRGKGGILGWRRASGTGCKNWSHKAPGCEGGTSTPGADQLPAPCSAKVCEEKLRYAAYNCVAIDTDMSPWEE